MNIRLLFGLFFLSSFIIFSSNAQDSPSPTEEGGGGGGNDDQSSQQIDKDLIYCIQNGKCGLSNICSFNLGNGAKEGRCFGSGCFNLTGHIMRIENDMDYDITFRWDILGEKSSFSSTTDRGGGDSTTKDVDYHIMNVPAHSERYFNTGHSTSHSVRLFVKNEPIDTTVASFDQCTTNEACEYLLRVCYSGAVDPKCSEYARHCHGFAKEDKNAKETCISDCIATYYAQDVKVDPSQIDPKLIIDYLSNGGGVIGSESFLTVMSSVPPGATTAIIVLAIYSLIITITLIIVAWKWWYSTRYGYSTDNIMLHDADGGGGGGNNSGYYPGNNGGGGTGIVDDYGLETSSGQNVMMRESGPSSPGLNTFFGSSSSNNNHNNPRRGGGGGLTRSRLD